MDRRRFLKTSALGAGGAAGTGLAAPALAQGRERLTMFTAWPQGAAGVWDAVEYFTRTVDELTDGTLEIDARAAGDPVGAYQIFDAVVAGQADLYHGADYYWTNQHPAWAYFTTVPFGLTAPEMMTWYYGGDGQAMHHMLGEVFGVRSWIAGQTGAQGGGWFREPVQSVEDFQGLRFRMPGIGAQVLSNLGASVTNLPAGDIYQALSSGELDATEFVGPWSDEALGLQEVATHYYPAGFHEPGAALSVGANLERLNQLSAQHQAALRTASAASHQQNYALYIANNGPALARMVQSGVQTHEFSPEIWDAFGRASIETLAEYRQDGLFAEIADSANASVAESSRWLTQTDNVYSRERNRVLSEIGTE